MVNETVALNTAQNLRAGLKAWATADPDVSMARLAKAFRDNWDTRVGKIKFGGVWSLQKAIANPKHPASTEALKLGRLLWKNGEATVEHAVPVKVLFPLFWDADTDERMQLVLDAYNVAVITKEEDDRLHFAGLQMKMPDGWSLGDDPLARWRTVGITVEGF